MRKQTLYMIGGAALFLLLGSGRADTPKGKPLSRAKTASSPSSHPKPTSNTSSSKPVVSFPSSLRVSIIGKRVLILGDSLSAESYPATRIVNGPPFASSPGQLLAKKLTAAGATVQVNAQGGRSATSFIHGKFCAKFPNGTKLCEPGTGEEQMEDIVRTFNPDIVLVMLGTNDSSGMGLGNPEKPVLSAYSKIINTFRDAGVKVIGIGPPDFSPEKWVSYKGVKGRIQPANDILVPNLKRLYGEKSFIDSRPLTADILTAAEGRSSDLIHFGSGGAEWVRRIVSSLL